jgi:hypothetical protein
MTFAVGIFSLLVLLSASSFVKASLVIDVSVAHAQINQLQSQTITVTANEGGEGTILVVQPGEGMSWTGFLDRHASLKTLWIDLPQEVQTEVLDETWGKILSFKTVTIGPGGGSVVVTFPDDFEGLNGEPSTALIGTYKVIFTFMSHEAGSSANCGHCCLFEIKFDCGTWLVIPENQLGTIVPLLMSLIALPVFNLYRRKSPHHTFTFSSRTS